ncbi:MAG TPA: SCP2 sterol-binding domain-containing protein [Gammaproteobacteria bacterium]|nr:SCP2 sterol-binding domain-containing protein [Gammaproteobacteria bacterium]HRA42655.1 SCP2 sterol-binding domain-containing protein [Gammaproteobacteria bacterium]
MQIDTIVNRALALDPNAIGQLKKLYGKCLEIFLKDFEKIFFMCFTETGIQFTLTKPEIPEKCDARISGPIKAFFNLALTKNSHQSAQLGLSFEGDFNTVEAIQQLFLSLDIDWVEATSCWTGDIMAHQLEKFAQHTKTRNVQLLKNTAENISEYLQEESLMLPTRIEVNRFMDNVDVLRADVDRLNARVVRLCQEAT